MGIKIGLAVCSDAKNFGSQLQILATIEILKYYGCETEIIQYKKKLTPTFLLQTLPRLFNISFLKSKFFSTNINTALKKYPDIQLKRKTRNQRFKNFANTYFGKLSPQYCGWENLVRNCKNQYDAFLCGSDQLWLPNNLGSHFYTLEFAPDDKPKIAYATSFGVNQIPWYQKKNTRKYLNRFQSLSTREIAGQKIVEELTGKKIEVVCDPTLLFTAKDWDIMIPKKRILEEPYIFCYFLGNNIQHREIANSFSKSKNIKIVSCPFLDSFIDADRFFGDIQLWDIDSADFVNLIRHAEYILTDSFHGTVFSILNHKKFMTFNRFSEGPNSRNSRIDSLCTLLGIEGRRFKGDVFTIENDIDFEKVEYQLRNLRDESMAFLKQALPKRD